MNYNTDLPQSGFVTPKWVQRRYSISNSTMYLWLDLKWLPPLHPIGRRAKRFRVEELREFEQRRTQGGAQ
ncbi:hypothetical protein MKK69_25935 [Methylobacterium sp. J-026]|uniref:helix-turn-helix transcriptional regulator n=1 Tax=Methylobacterium sp. J-026 TaxID=2836624 RepID=UPI001FBAFFF4|nr:hypothetical protein [Methylobacterium sp. J-026]MCJ2137441.1 hypothetical protein [Methylobacterium sp. J-026]